MDPAVQAARGQARASGEAVPTQRRNLLSYVEALPRFGEREAFLWREGVRWRRRTYADLHRRILSCAAALSAAGLRPGDAVLIQGPDGADWIEALLGTLWAGGVAVPLESATPDDLRARIAAKVGGRLLLSQRDVAPPAGARRIELGSWAELAAAARDSSVDPGPEDRAEIIFTSGTTGDPKGVILTHGNLLSDFAPIERAYLKRERLVRAFGALRFLTTLPLSHMFGQAMNVFLAATMGLTVVFVPPRPRDVLEASRRLRAWGLFTVPRLLDLLAAELRRSLQEEGRLEIYLKRQERFAGRPFYLQALLLPRLQRMFGWRFRLIVSGGARLPEPVDLFFRRSGYLVVQGYGLTETAPIVSISNPFDRAAGSVGRPLAIQEVKLGPDNEVLVRGPNVTSGYLGAQDGFEGGWFRTGDLGEFDGAGRLRIRGRVKDVIVTAEGENVHPGDVEAAFLGQPGVRGVSVLGWPMERGERVHAVLLLDPGITALEAVRRANERLLPKQRVRGHTVWPDEDFPRTSTGKVRRSLLRERAIALERAAAAAPGATADREPGGVRRLVASIANVRPENLQSSTRLGEGLGLASLDLVELAAAFEEEFGVSLPEERLGAATIADLERIVLSAASPPADPDGSAPVPVPGTPGISHGAPGSQAGPPTSAGGEPGAPPAPIEAGRRDPAVHAPRMPHWTRLWFVRCARRLIEEVVLVPIVRLYARPQIIGLEHLKSARPPYLFVPNHRSFMDSGLFKAQLPRPLRGRIAPGMTTRHHRGFFGEVDAGRFRYLKESFQIALVESLFNAWPLPETAGIRGSLSYAGELMDEGYSILIFPEGRHVPPPGIEPFRKGIGIFARDLRAPVIPAYIEGTDRVLPNGRYWPRFGRTRLILGPPLHVDPDADAAEVTRQIEAAVRRLGPTPT
ncbi:MAG TPA: AMP-binding protein [Candidatus Polarisedimenticolia bacterium]|nr:AMP-binding protein [Candidatus Polarisedimenticolia bacterium]